MSPDPCLHPPIPQDFHLYLVTWLNEMALLFFPHHLLMMCTLCPDSFRDLPLIRKRAWLLQSSSYNFKNPLRNSKSPEFKLFFFFFFSLYYCSNNLILPWGTGCHWLNRQRAPECFVKVRKAREVGRLVDNISKESSGYKGMQMLVRTINSQLLRLLIHSLNKYLLNTYYLLS